MRRLLDFAGLAVMALALSALLLVAGWRFWPDGAVTQGGGPSAGRAGAALPEDQITWLISETGGPVPAADLQAYLLQDRSTPNRVLAITMVGALDRLLQDGEVLPDPAYHEVMADIRAPLLAEGLCPVLSAILAERCIVVAARVEKGSLDPLRGTAVFKLHLRYSQPSDPNDLPDLARQVLKTRLVEFPADAESPESAEAALLVLLLAAEAACGAEDGGQACRILRLTLDFAPGRPATGSAVIGSLYALPGSLRTAPELLAAPKG